MDCQGKIAEYLSQSLGWSVDIKDLGPFMEKIPYGYAGAADYSLLNIEGYSSVAIKPFEGNDFASVKRLTV